MNLPALVVAFLLPAHIVPFAPGDSASTGRDSAFVRPDSILRIVPLPRAGSLLRVSGSTASTITDSAKNFLDYRTPADLAGGEAGAYLRDFGSPGRLPDLTFGGLGGRNIAWLRDGVLLNDPLSGLFDPNLLPAEEAGRIEIFSGTSSFLYGLNAAGAAINVVTRNSGALHPRSRLRYSESGDGYSLVDGSVSEDVIRGLTVTAGAQHVTFGPRFLNSGYDAWAGRLRTRYVVSPGLECFFAWNYAHTQLGLDGGVDPGRTPASLWFDERQANVRNGDAYEKRTREDLQAGATFRLPSDTAGATTLTAYYSSDLREFRDEENRPEPNGIFFSQNERSDRSGFTVGHARTLAGIGLDAAAEFRSERILVTPAATPLSSSPFDARARAVISPLPFVRISPGFRYDRVGTHSELGWGADLALPAGPLELFGGYSRSFRFPSAVERYGLDTLLGSALDDASVESHRLAEGGVRLACAGWLRTEAACFQRTIDGPFLVEAGASGAAHPFRVIQGDRITLRGVRAALNLRSGWLEIDGTALFLERADDGNPAGGREEGVFPKWTADAGCYYRDTLFGAHLDLKAGVRGRYVGASDAEAFNDQALIYLPSGSGGAGAFPVGEAGIVDFLIVARIGDAHLHFTWENLGDKQYFLIAGYPMPGRQIRLGVSWEFLN